jgi:hypothetical protein
MFSPVTGLITTSSLITVGNILFHVMLPTTPSSFNPFVFCQDLTALSVFEPKLPSATKPNFFWKGSYFGFFLNYSCINQMIIKISSLKDSNNYS